MYLKYVINISLQDPKANRQKSEVAEILLLCTFTIFEIAKFKTENSIS